MTKTTMTKEEILNRLSDVIYYYQDAHKGGESEEEEKEIAKNIEASEAVESYFKKHYIMAKKITKKTVTKEKKDFEELSDKKLIQHYKDFKWDFENVLSVGKYECIYLESLENELEKRNLI